MSVDLNNADLGATPEAEAFYVESLRELKTAGLPFLLAGTYAVCAYTGLTRATKDLDIFCRPGDYPRVLAHFRKLGYDTEVEDERWLAKVRKGQHFFDVIFNSTTALTPVTDQWFGDAPTTRVYGIEVRLTPPTELILSKAFVQSRERYDGADVAHLILKRHDGIDWRRLLSYMDQYWEVLLIHILNFQFIYPTERNRIPRWLFDELMQRLSERSDLPVPQVRICRGRLFSRSDYRIDVAKWGFADLIGGGEGENG